MVAKLNQIIAIESRARSSLETDFTRAYHQVQRPDLFAGQIRIYVPTEDDGEVQPSQSQKVQVTIDEVLDGVVASLTSLFDLTAAKMTANTKASADVVVDGKVLLKAVPVEYLLFLEKRLGDLGTFLNKVPLLDRDVTWHWDAERSLFASEEVIAKSTKKVPRTLEKAKATDKFPAQVEVWYEDATVGHWHTTRLSGALSTARLAKVFHRLAELRAAVVSAREQANLAEAPNVAIGKTIFDWLFAGSGH